MAVRTLVTAFACGTAIAFCPGSSWADSVVFEPVEELVEAKNHPKGLVTIQPQSDQESKDQAVVVDRFPNGKAKIRRRVALDKKGNFVNHGDYSVHAPDGRKIGGGRYQLGQRTGEWIRIHDQSAPVIAENASRGFVGPYTSTATFLHDKLHGDWSITDGKQRPIVLWQFSHGRREGHWLWFNIDGTTRKQAHFKNDQIDGDIVAPVGKDKLKVLVAYIDGRELAKHSDRYSTRQVKSEGHHLKPHEETRIDVDWWNGTLTAHVVKRKGEQDRHGEWRFYHPNGKVRVVGTYNAGKETGRFTWFHENGQKSSEGYFENGQKHGSWEMWYANGERQTAGAFVGGKHDSTWMSWHENGMPKLKAKYVQGRLAQANRWDKDGLRLENVVAHQEEVDQDSRLSAKPVDGHAEADVSWRKTQTGERR